MSTIKMWEPLWSTHQPRTIDRDEAIAIDQIILAADLGPKDLEPVLDIKGRKFLRVKLFKGIDSSILTYDYLFFGPLVFAGKNVSLVDQPEHGATNKNRNMTKMLNKEGLIAEIKTTVRRHLKKRERFKEAS